MTIISRLTIKPADAAMGICLPLTMSEYNADLHDPGKDFIRDRNPGWAKYQKEVVHFVEQHAGLLRQLGVTVVNRLTLAGWGELFEDARYKVVILVAHWAWDPRDRKPTIEFADGLAGLDEVVKGIPKDFAGIIDLSVCNPPDLVRLIKIQRPECLVRWAPKPASPAVWMLYFAMLFKLLASRDMVYLAAMELTVAEIFRQGRNHDGTN